MSVVIIFCLALLSGCEFAVGMALQSIADLESSRTKDYRDACIGEPYKIDTTPKDRWYYIDWYNTCKETCQKYPEPMKRGLFPNTNWNDEKAKKWEKICKSYDQSSSSHNNSVLVNSVIDADGNKVINLTP